MNEYLEKAIPIVDNELRFKFESIWKDEINIQLPEYRILIWGSTINPEGKKPRDLDIIIEYVGPSIEPEQEKLIERRLHKETHLLEFSYIDPLVVHYHETNDIISKSTVCRTYSVDEKSWLKFS